MSTKPFHRGNHRPWTPSRIQEYLRWSIERAPAPCQEVLTDFALWLAEQRGAQPGTIVVRLCSTRAFVTAVLGGARSLPEALGRLDVAGVEDHFVAYGQDHGPSARRQMQSAMRRFLEFSAERGWSDRRLAEAVPSLRSRKLSGVPRALPEADLRRLLDATAEDGTSSRDRTVILLLASYGIRRGQVVTLELGDVDWRGRLITFRAHKGGKPVQQTLTAAVAESLSRYLRHERPPSDSPTVFLRSRPPYLPLGPSAVSELVRAHLLRLGLGQPNLRARGPHALRHAFVARLLRAGQPLKVIADLLGHRSLSAVAHYAKVDHPRLFEVAGDWPEVHS